MQVTSIPLSDIADREASQRDGLSDHAVDSLAESITNYGLFNPITVAMKKDGTFELIAGAHRLAAVRSLIGTPLLFGDTDITPDHIPAVVFSTPDNLRKYAIELEENTVRTQLSWQEQSRAVKKLAEFEALRTGRQTSLTSLSELSDRSIASVSDDIFLSDFTDDPEVNRAKTRKEALAVARRKMERDFRAALDATIDTSGTVNASVHTFHHASAFDILPTLDETFACILTDPPYGIGVDTYGYSDGKAHPYEDTIENATRCYELLATHGERLLGGDGHLYAFCGSTMFDRWKTLFEDHGWHVWQSPLIWVRNSGRTPTKLGPQKIYDMILYARVGSRPTNRTDSDVIVTPADGGLRGAQKPLSLYSNLLARSALPGERVLDPFCGTGTIFPAATAAGVLATGIEVDDEVVEYTKSRMSPHAE